MLLKLERSGHTRNDRYFREYKDKFLSHFKLQREPETTAKGGLLRDLNNMASQNGTQPHAHFRNGVNQGISALAKVGLPVDVLQLAKLISSESSDPALEDMAAACAGFEGASHRVASFLRDEALDTINS